MEGACRQPSLVTLTKSKRRKRKDAKSPLVQSESHGMNRIWKQYRCDLMGGKVVLHSWSKRLGKQNSDGTSEMDAEEVKEDRLCLYKMVQDKKGSQCLMNQKTLQEATLH